MKKRMIALLTALVLTVSILPTALAVEAASADGISCVLDENGKLTVSGKGVVGYAESFENNTQIVEIVIEEGITAIAMGTFYGCTNLERVTLPDSLSAIHADAFANCSALETVSIPANVEIVSCYAFSGCSSLDGIWVDGANEYYANDKYGVLFSKDMTWLEAAPDTLSGSYTIPASVKNVRSEAFADCVALTDVTIQNCTGYALGSGVFANCTGLEGVTFSAGVGKLGFGWFEGCTGLKNIYFEGNVPGYDALSPLEGVTATCCYPVDNETWTEEVMKDYGGDLTWVASFVDVKPMSWFAPYVKWAVDNDITSGMGDSLFAPDNTCTRAQVVTFLWRANGSPKMDGAENPFVDVKAGDYFYDAVLWAVKNGITNGMDDTHFKPESTCTRAQVVTFLWRAEDKPAPGSSTNPFADVKNGEFSGWYYDAVLWAVEKGITNGIDDTHFAPNNTCTRAQIVTFLFRNAA